MPLLDIELRELAHNARVGRLHALGDREEPLELVALGLESALSRNLKLEAQSQGFSKDQRILAGSVPKEALARALQDARLDRAGIEALSLNLMFERGKPLQEGGAGVPVQQFALPELSQTLRNLNERAVVTL